ncbi:MAG TPA: hypothetical protein VER96_29030 [Polyangiaceae bacterium]|nr:hypothetical protein [Polyangiaceae bacterium]
MTERAEKNLLKRERDLVLAWPAPEVKAYFAEGEESLKAMLKQAPSPANGRKCASHFANLQDLLTNEGLSLLFNESPSGWQRLHEAQRLRLWEARIQEHAFQLDKTPDRFRRALSVGSFPASLLSLHLGARDTAEAIMGRLVAESHDSHCNYWRASTPSLAFMARLFELLSGTKLDIVWGKLLPMGRYEELLLPDLDGERYASALDWACTEHIAQTRMTQKQFLPFVTHGFAPLPIELVMCLRYRRASGFECATLGHPLLQSPLATLDPPGFVETPCKALTLLAQSMPHVRAYLES